jgi:hypothetical protein
MSFMVDFECSICCGDDNDDDDDYVQAEAVRLSIIISCSLRHISLSELRTKQYLISSLRF